MDPFFASNRLSDYIDGQLSDEEAAEIARALDTNPALRAEYDAMQQAVSLLRTHGPTTAPPDFHANVMAAVGAQGRPGVVVQLRDFFRQVPLEAVALAAAAIIVVVVLLDPSAPPDDGAPAMVDVRGGAVAPIADIEPAADFTLPSASASAQPAPAPAPAPAAEAKPSPSTSLASKLEGIETPKEAYVPDWERKAEIPMPTTEPEPEPASATTEDAGADAMENVKVTPDELTGGVQADVATPYEYRITLGDADVLFSLQQLAQSAEGRLLDHRGEPMAARALTEEQNYARVQLVVPPGKAEQVHARLKELGGRAVMPANGTPLYGAQYVAFVIEVSYLP